VASSYEMEAAAEDQPHAARRPQQMGSPTRSQALASHAATPEAPPIGASPWREARTPDGKSYFVNDVTRETVSK